MVAKTNVAKKSKVKDSDITSSLVIVQTTVDSAELAASMAQSLVEKKLAACVHQISNVRSTYRWENHIENGLEIVLQIKTTQACADAVKKHILSLHSYELPEIIVLPILHANDAYAAWIRTEVKK